MVATRTRNYGSPLVVPVPAKTSKRHDRKSVLVTKPQWKRGVYSVFFGLLGMISHGVLVNVYGRTCGINPFNPASWLLGMYSVNSTWCSTLHWLTHATSMVTEKMAADASVGSRNVPAFLRGRGAGYTTASDASLDTSIEDFEYLREGAFPPGSPVRGS